MAEADVVSHLISGEGRPNRSGWRLKERESQNIVFLNEIFVYLLVECGTFSIVGDYKFTSVTTDLGYDAVTNSKLRGLRRYTLHTVCSAYSHALLMTVSHRSPSRAQTDGAAAIWVIFSC